MLHHGLYEQVINNQLTSELAEIPEARKAVAPIDKAEASKVLAQYLSDVVQKGLDNVLAPLMSPSCTLSLKKKLPPPTVLTCWCPSSSGAVYAS